MVYFCVMGTRGSHNSVRWTVDPSQSPDARLHGVRCLLYTRRKSNWSGGEIREDNLVKWEKMRFGGVSIHEFLTISLLEDPF